MKHILFVGLIFFVILSSCSKGNSKSVNIPDPNEMAKVVADIHLAESSLSTLSAKAPTLEHPRYFKSVLDKYHLNKDDFDSAVAYYSARPDEYQKIYEKVIEILTAKELEVKALKDDKVIPSKPDTLNLWVGERMRKINAIDSTRLNAEFSFFTDSVIGGSVSLILKHRFNSAKLKKDGHKCRLNVEYSDGKKDSIDAVINNLVVSDVQARLDLQTKRVKRVYGWLIVVKAKENVSVDVIDIRLKWTMAKPVGEKVVKTL